MWLRKKDNSLLLLLNKQISCNSGVLLKIWKKMQIDNDIHYHLSNRTSHFQRIEFSSQTWKLKVKIQKFWCMYPFCKWFNYITSIVTFFLYKKYCFSKYHPNLYLNQTMWALLFHHIHFKDSYRNIVITIFHQYHSRLIYSAAHNCSIFIKALKSWMRGGALIVDMWYIKFLRLQREHN